MAQLGGFIKVILIASSFLFEIYFKNDFYLNLINKVFYFPKENVIVPNDEVKTFSESNTPTSVKPMNNFLTSKPNLNSKDRYNKLISDIENKNRKGLELSFTDKLIGRSLCKGKGQIKKYEKIYLNLKNRYDVVNIAKIYENMYYMKKIVFNSNQRNQFEFLNVLTDFHIDDIEKNVLEKKDDIFLDFSNAAENAIDRNLKDQIEIKLNLK